MAFKDNIEAQQPLPGFNIRHGSTSTTFRHNEKPLRDRKERLRRFLSFCLAIDYDLVEETPDQLSKADRCHFVDLGQRCFLCRGHDRPLLKADRLGYLYTAPADITVDDPVVQSDLMQPAMELGIPCTAAVTMLRLFIHSFSFRLAGYNSQIEWLVRKTSVDNLAARFWMERRVIIKAVEVPGEKAFFDRIVEGMQKALGSYFQGVRGPEEYKAYRRGRKLKSKECSSSEDRLSGQKLVDEEGEFGIRKDCKRAALMAECVWSATKDDPLAIRLVRFWITRGHRRPHITPEGCTTRRRP
ncbi:unnamed protein product [Zymoseptoria tritici ST99CH_1A5]|uniref:Uncharacterized protein n=1 Tax=Zymoseptoria tritici ST99CH_1A5 TaxID=1276529 RepID=A0A1Y6LCH1_ZYMTR|nr:unnamed protein product [Zymoseptoria tritici ST99CH_1A5]